MVQANDAYKHGRYEKIWLKSLHVMSIAKVFAIQDGWPAGRPSHKPDKHNFLHRSINTNMDQKEKMSSPNIVAIASYCSQTFIKICYIRSYNKLKDYVRLSL